MRAGMMAGLIPTGLKAIGKEDVFSSTAPQPSALNYVRLGRTELMISEVSFGASRLRDGEENLVRHALDRDVNYFDTAESYTGSSSEKVLGNALKGVRDKVYIATKTFCGNDTSAQTLMGSLESSLQRLKTDYVDIFFNHAVNDVTRLENPEWMAFIEKAREQGKLRFSGMSGHAGRLADCLTYGLDQDMFDVILVATNFGEDPAFYENFTQRL
ncbi:MAG: aldo/keto reductase, partial [Gammaproteobacteria bacterium]|nr:aldo/keto reductase [Gammaproteobacteria bacterium]